jgi:cellulose synthase/poly-beta-1,6-N-acetylglucosamine synthase-like glycosyltransferase
MDFPTVTVAIPAFNEGGTVYGTIKSVAELDYPRQKLQIIAVNDGSEDNTLAEINRARADFAESNIQVINQDNGGKARALNAALALTEGEFFACLDADSEVDRLTLKKMLQVFFESGPRVAVVTPAMKVKEPGNLLQRLQRVEYIVSILLQRMLAKLDAAYVAPGPFSVYRTGVVRNIGGFDHTDITEDQEIAYRMQLNNHKIAHCHDGYVRTECPKNVYNLFRQRNRWNKGSILLVFKYRKMMMNKKYGNFGIFQMPLNLFYYIMGVGAVFFFMYFTLRPLARQVKELYLVNFDLFTLFKDFRFEFSVLDINLGITFIVLMVFMLTFIVFYLAHKNAHERMKAKGILPLAGYFFAYYLLLGFFVCMALIEIVIGRRQKW